MLRPPSVLLLYVHPDSPDSVANRRLLASAKRLANVTIHDLYACYPDFFIDVYHEQQLLSEHQVVVFQHPLYTYSCPALLKEWIDRVLSHDFASGKKRHAMAGKYWRSVITTGEAESAFCRPGVPSSLTEILRPFELTAKICRMHWLTPLVLYQARRQPPALLQAFAENYAHWLASPLPKGS